MRKTILIALGLSVAGCSGLKPDPELASDESHTLLTANLIDDGYTRTVFPSPKASEWQESERGRIDELTTEAALNRFLVCAETADALCACVKSGYRGDALKLTQIQAISTLVMNRGYETKRRLWVAALERAKEASTTNDVDTFFRQQLELCGYSAAPISN